MTDRAASLATEINVRFVRCGSRTERRFDLFKADGSLIADTLPLRQASAALVRRGFPVRGAFLAPDPAPKAAA